ncbi:alpha/beta hydrolase [Humitalea rosea]|nr:alpha/beta hydrolase [Humitalea rosea]
MLLLHGAAAGAWVWEQGFSDRLNELGFTTASFTFRRIGRGGGPAGLEDFLAETRAALAALRAALGQPALLVAHSLGGLVAQRLLGEPSVTGAALLAPVPPGGLWWSNMRLAFTDPYLWGDVARMSGPIGKAPMGELAAGLFGGLTPEQAAPFLLHLGGESRTALLEAQGPQPVSPHVLHRKPVLVLGGERDRLIAADALARCAAWHGTVPQFMPGTGHLMMLDASWPEVADRIATWARGLPEPAP